MQFDHIKVVAPQSARGEVVQAAVLHSHHVLSLYLCTYSTYSVHPTPPLVDRFTGDTSLQWLLAASPLRGYIKTAAASQFLLSKRPWIAVEIMILANWLIAASAAGLATAQYFPPTPEGLKVVNSKHEEGVKISYKEVCALW